ncbi:MAG: zinc ABC transporter substrate-binding protein [Aerococcus sp.]|nr:zinc ABC transporter substrate-binding protein [Aerococcus sp.]
MKHSHKKFWLLFFACLLMMTGCAKSNQEKTAQTSSSDTQQQNAKDKMNIVVTNTILKDMVENVVGDHGAVYSIVPAGQDPHEWQVVPEDVKHATDADVIFYNALNLETANSWFEKMMEQAQKKENQDFYAVSKNVTPIYLESEGQQGQQDPHAWLNIQNGIKYVEEMTTVLKEKDPDHANDYEKNAKSYIEKLTTLHNKYQDAFQDIPESKRLLIASEGAFKYFSRAYGLENAYIWEINTEKQGTPDQMKAITDKIKSSEVPVLFVESSVDHRTMEKVSQEVNRPIYAEIYTDSVGIINDDDKDKDEKTDFQVDTYYGMMHWNLEKIHAGLSQSL